MERIDKIFAALDCCKDTETPACETCPYTDPDIGTCDTLTPLYEDIRAEILDRRPRLLTAEDFHGNPDMDDGGAIPCWKESRKPTRRSGWAVICYGKWLGDTEGGTCRYWTGKPTEEQREATPWE